MKRIFKKATEHIDGLFGITTNQNFPKKRSLLSSRIEEHKELRKKAEESIERREKESRENKTKQITSD